MPLHPNDSCYFQQRSRQDPHLTAQPIVRAAPKPPSPTTTGMMGTWEVQNLYANCGSSSLLQSSPVGATNCQHASRTALATHHRDDCHPQAPNLDSQLQIQQNPHLLAQPIASAPPEPPSPITTEMMGTRKPNISRRFTAIASPWPSSSADLPAGRLPGGSGEG